VTITGAQNETSKRVSDQLSEKSLNKKDRRREAVIFKGRDPRRKETRESNEAT